MKTHHFFFLFLLFLVSGLLACEKEDEQCIENPDPACYCIEIYDPVCGCNEVTYSNSCFAECAGISDYTPGPCLGD